MEYPSQPAIWQLSGWSCLCQRRCWSACPRVAGLVGLHLLPTPYEAPPICSLTNSTPSAVAVALPNGRLKCAGSAVMLTEIDIITGNPFGSELSHRAENLGPLENELLARNRG